MPVLGPNLASGDKVGLGLVYSWSRSHARHGLVVGRFKVVVGRGSWKHEDGGLDLGWRLSRTCTCSCS